MKRLLFWKAGITPPTTLCAALRAGLRTRSYIFTLTILFTSLCIAIVFLKAADSASPPELDSDGDQLPDDFEIFFGLNPADPADAWLDYDGDLLSNLEESKILTDPFSLDTDFDGFRDDFDAVPISRAYLPFGVELFTHGDFCEYARPAWCLGAWKNSGEWITNPPAWRVAGSESNLPAMSTPQALQAGGVAGLLIAVDRSILTNNLRFAIRFEGRATASGRAALFLDLLDTNAVVVAGDLFGNLLTISNATEHVVIPAEAGIQSNSVVLLLNIPTAQFSSAAVIHLRHGEGEVVVPAGLLYISEDGDELDADQERQLGTSDYLVDSNGNGVSDYAEWLNSTSGGSSTNNPGGGGDSGGGEPGEEDEDQTKKGIIYVDQSIGDDTLSGYSAEISGNKGPKKTVRAGLSITETNDTIIIKSGNYNENLNIMGRDLKVFIEGKVRL